MKKLIIVVAAMVCWVGCGEAKKTDGAKADNIPAENKPVAAMQISGAMNTSITSGVESLRKGNIKQAIQNFDEAIKENPKEVQGYLILGQTYMHLKEYNRAIDTFMVATQVAPENGQAHYLLATNFGLAGNFEMARLQAQKSAEIFRKNKDENNFKRSVALLQGLPASKQMDKTQAQ